MIRKGIMDEAAWIPPSCATNRQPPNLHPPASYTLSYYIDSKKNERCKYLRTSTKPTPLYSPLSSSSCKLNFISLAPLLVELSHLIPHAAKIRRNTNYMNNQARNTSTQPPTLQTIIYTPNIVRITYRGSVIRSICCISLMYCGHICYLDRWP